MNFIAPRAEPLIREIPLSRLALAPENVRKTPPDPRADAELKASIAALGLLENLVVRTDEPDENGIERFAVAAGGRRLKVMQALVEDNVLDADHPVPCLVKTGDVEAAELSLAENVVRIAMHPADQVVAFTKLVQAGQSVSSVAARFGLSERLVEQRLQHAIQLSSTLRVKGVDDLGVQVVPVIVPGIDTQFRRVPGRREPCFWSHERHVLGWVGAVRDVVEHDDGASSDPVVHEPGCQAWMSRKRRDKVSNERIAFIEGWNLDRFWRGCNRRRRWRNRRRWCLDDGLNGRCVVTASKKPIDAEREGQQRDDGDANDPAAWLFVASSASRLLDLKISELCHC